MPSLEDATRGRILFGGDYNPEQWPREVWHEDMRLMREAGVNLATVGVFSWAMLEPTPGAREFGWLDEVLDLLHANGIGVALATPTASPPPWMGHRWPQTLPRNQDGTVRTYGSRNSYCPSSPVYRRFADEISADLAARYAHHPAVTMWHIGNEFGTVCYCEEACAQRFRTWLQAKYKDLDGLNEAWGTAFWSQRYSDWAEVIPPRQVQYVINPTQDLDYQRFTSDVLLERFATERDLVRAHNPAIPVTTNFMGFYKGTDSWRWAAEEDFVSLDTYPDPSDPDAARDGAMAQDLTRSLGGGKPWLLMEQSPAAAGWRHVATPKRPGLNRLWSMQALARGADGILHFQWRASKQGAERTHGAMIPHAGPDSRVFREICELGKELAELSGLPGRGVGRSEVGLSGAGLSGVGRSGVGRSGSLGSSGSPESVGAPGPGEPGSDLSADSRAVEAGVPADARSARVSADVAILMDWDSWRAVELDHQPHSGFRYLDRIREYYTPLWRANVTVDFAHPEADLRTYKLVVAPNLYQVSDAAAANLINYVRQGGRLVLGPFSGVSDPDERIRLGGYPAPFRDLLGLRVEEYWPLPDGEPLELRSELFGDFTAASWAEWLTIDRVRVSVSVNGKVGAIGADGSDRDGGGRGSSESYGNDESRYGSDGSSTASDSRDGGIGSDDSGSGDGDGGGERDIGAGSGSASRDGISSGSGSGSGDGISSGSGSGDGSGDGDGISSAEPLAEITSGPLTGIPAILRHAYGAGTAWYVATLPEERVLAQLLHLACAEADVQPVLPGLPPGVEAVRRGDLIFVLDHNTCTVEIQNSAKQVSVL